MSLRKDPFRTTGEKKPGTLSTRWPGSTSTFDVRFKGENDFYFRREIGRRTEDIFYILKWNPPTTGSFTGPKGLNKEKRYNLKSKET
jgi:hypothetical protein